MIMGFFPHINNIYYTIYQRVYCQNLIYKSLNCNKHKILMSNHIITRNHKKTLIPKTFLHMLKLLLQISIRPSIIIVLC